MNAFGYLALLAFVYSVLVQGYPALREPRSFTIGQVVISPPERCRCFADEYPFCSSLVPGGSYTCARFPNSLNHSNVKDVKTTVSPSLMQSMIESSCSSKIRELLCVHFFPFCMDIFLKPCKSLCQEVKGNCESEWLAATDNVPWPQELDCDNENLFPPDADLCVSSDSNLTSDTGTPRCMNLDGCSASPTTPEPEPTEDDGCGERHDLERYGYRGLCDFEGFDYSYAYLPNALGQKDFAQIKGSMPPDLFVNATRSTCSRLVPLRQFLCFTFIPGFCKTSNTKSWISLPCQHMCEVVKEGCQDELAELTGRPWPINCSQFPVPPPGSDADSMICTKEIGGEATEDVLVQNTPSSNLVTESTTTPTPESTSPSTSPPPDECPSTAAETETAAGLRQCKMRTSTSRKTFGPNNDFTFAIKATFEGIGNTITKETTEDYIEYPIHVTEVFLLGECYNELLSPSSLPPPNKLKVTKYNRYESETCNTLSQLNANNEYLIAGVYDHCQPEHERLILDVRQKTTALIQPFDQLDRDGMASSDIRGWLEHRRSCSSS